jgi:hypothetical protein
MRDEHDVLTVAVEVQHVLWRFNVYLCPWIFFMPTRTFLPSALPSGQLSGTIWFLHQPLISTHLIVSITALLKPWLFLSALL